MATVRRLRVRPSALPVPAWLRSRALGEHALAVLVSLMMLLMLVRVGPTLSVFLVLITALVLLAVSDARVFAFGVLLLTPLPALGALIGYEFPLGVEPLNLLVMLGLLLLLVTSVKLVKPSPALAAIIGVNLLLLTISWVRTYGEDGISPQDMVLTIKPALLILGGFLLVSIVPREQLLPAVALGMFATLMILEFSVLLQRAGVYQTSYQADNLDRLAFKQYGGILLQGNVAGSFVAVFTIPAYLLLRKTGHERLGLIALVLAFPMILVTLSRTAMIGFLVGLLVFFIFSERSLRGVLTVLAAVGVSVLFATTLGQQQTDFLVENFQRYGNNSNAQLSGRESIWAAVLDFLGNEPGRVYFGGGLDSFREEVTRSLGQPYSTHNAFLYALANGGALMLIATVGLWLYCLQRWRGVPSEVATGIRLAAFIILVVSLSSDTTPYSAAVAWIWVLIALAHRLRDTEEEPRPAPA